MKRTALLLIALACAGASYAEEASLRPGEPAGAVRSVAEAYVARTREVVLQALGYLGVPYRFGGSSPEAGFDCSGLVGYVVRQAIGIALPRDARAMSHVGKRVGPEELQTGDLVFFNTLRKPFSHVGIYLGDNQFVHAPRTGGAVEVVDMRKAYWQSRFDGARRLSF